MAAAERPAGFALSAFAPPRRRPTLQDVVIEKPPEPAHLEPEVPPLPASARASPRLQVSPSSAGLADPSRANELHKLRSSLEEIKVATMEGMVEKVSFTIDEEQVMASFMYLTNQQAAAIDISKMAMVREKLGIKSPKMLIRLMPSHHSSVYWKAFPHWNTARNDGRFPCMQVPELTIEDQQMTEHRVVLFAKEVLLPLAIEGNALVMGNETCALVNAFARVSAPLQRQLGDDCPFQLLIFAKAYYFHLKADQDGTVVSKFRQRSEHWTISAMEHKMEQALGMQYGEDPAYWPQADLFVGSYSLVMFECLGRTDLLVQEPSRNFQNDFLNALSHQIPVIALKTYGTSRMNYIPVLADHANSGLPLVLLDSRVRDVEEEPLCFSPANEQQLEELFTKEIKQTLWALQTALHNKGDIGCTDAYTTSLMAFLKGRVNRLLGESESENQTANQRGLRLWEAIKMARAIRLRSHQVVKFRKSLAHTADAAKTLWVAATDLLVSYVGDDIEWETNTMERRCMTAIEEILATGTWDELSQKLQENWIRIRCCTFHSYTGADRFCKENPWCVKHDCKRDVPEGRYSLRIDLDARRPDFGVGKQRLRKLLLDEFEQSKSHNDMYNTRKAWTSNEQLWCCVYDIMKSSNVYVGGLEDRFSLKRELFALGRIDRLPSWNSLESLLLLRRAWVLVDVFAKFASFYEACCKLSYFVSLLLHVAVVTVSVGSAEYPEWVSEDNASHLVLGLALCASLISGTATIMDPTTKWFELRGSTLALESEIWKFRTRVGAYQSSATFDSSLGRGSAERHAELTLHATMHAVQTQVLQSSGLKDSAFYASAMPTDDDATEASPLMPCGEKKKQSWFGARSSPKWCKHGQYEHSRSRGCAMDDHHSPAAAADYIKLRLVPQMAYYQQRIRRYSRWRRTFQAQLVLASILSALLASLDIPWATAIVATASSSLAAWQEFYSMHRKLERYSTAAGDLADTLMWWQALPEVEQASRGNVERLVERTEALLGGERIAWLSDAQQTVTTAVQQAIDQSWSEKVEVPADAWR